MSNIENGWQLIGNGLNPLHQYNRMLEDWDCELVDRPSFFTVLGINAGRSEIDGFKFASKFCPFQDSDCIVVPCGDHARPRTLVSPCATPLA